MSSVKGKNVALNFRCVDSRVAATLVFFADEHNKPKMRAFLLDRHFEKGFIRVCNKRGKIHAQFEDVNFCVSRLLKAEKDSEVTNEMYCRHHFTGKISDFGDRLVLFTDRLIDFNITVADDGDIVVEDVLNRNCWIDTQHAVGIDAALGFTDEERGESIKFVKSFPKVIMDEMFKLFFIRPNIDIESLIVTKKVDGVLTV